MAWSLFTTILAATSLLYLSASVYGQGKSEGFEERWGGHEEDEWEGHKEEGWGGHKEEGWGGHKEEGWGGRKEDGWGGHKEGWRGHKEGGWGRHDKSADQCVVSHGEIECTHLILELILKTAMVGYIERNPHRKTQAPWFDPFKHVTYYRDERCMDTVLDLLSSVDVRESLTFCTKSYGNNTSAYVPSSPGQMYKDMCAENARLRAEIQNQ